MTTSQTEIANLALIDIGEETLNDLADDKPTAEILRVLYGPVRDWVLRDYPWNFAIGRIELADTGTPPAWSTDRYGEDRVYPLPADCLKALTINGANPRADLWKVEGRTIVTNLPPPLQLRYTKKIEDESLFDTSFIKAFAKRLAAELAIRISEDKDRKMQLEDEYNRVVADARSADGQEGTPRQVTSTSWQEARNTSGIVGAIGDVWLRR